MKLGTKLTVQALGRVLPWAIGRTKMTEIRLFPEQRAIEFRIHLQGEAHPVEGRLEYAFFRKGDDRYAIECQFGKVSTANGVLSAVLAFLPEKLTFEVPRPAAKLTELFVGPALVR